MNVFYRCILDYRFYHLKKNMLEFSLNLERLEIIAARDKYSWKYGWIFA